MKKVLIFLLLICFVSEYLYSQVEFSFVLNKDSSIVLLKVENLSSDNYFIPEFRFLANTKIYKKCGLLYFYKRSYYSFELLEQWYKYAQWKSDEPDTLYNNKYGLSDSMMSAKLDSIRNIIVDSLHFNGQNADMLIYQALYPFGRGCLTKGWNEQFIIDYIRSLCGLGLQHQIEAHTIHYFLIVPTNLYKDGKYKFVFDYKPSFEYIEHREVFQYPPFEVNNPERFFGYKKYQGKVTASSFYVKIFERKYQHKNIQIIKKSTKKRSIAIPPSSYLMGISCFL